MTSASTGLFCGHRCRRATGSGSVPPWPTCGRWPESPACPRPGRAEHALDCLHPETTALYRDLLPDACSRRARRQAVGLPPAMARSSSGKSVARAAATGGGTTYRGQMPVNWYAALVIIVIIGVASIAWPSTTTTSRRPWSSPQSGRPGTPASPSTSAGPWSPHWPPRPPRPRRASPPPATGSSRSRRRQQRGREQRHAGQVRRRVYRPDADQHLAQVPVVQGTGYSNGEHCPTGDARRRQPA